MTDSSRKKLNIVLVLLLLCTGGYVLLASQEKEIVSTPVQTISELPEATIDPEYKTEDIATGLSNVWDIKQAPDSTLFFTERANKINTLINGKVALIHEASDVVVKGEGGMLGMELDPKFSENRFLYACFNTATDIRVARFKVNPGNTALTNRTDIITGLPVNPSGRHSGCRPVFGPDGYLWIGTGDTARSEFPQSKTSLGGKVLRVDRDGKAVPGNQGEGFDARIFSYGHRNVQGLAFFKQARGNVVGYSTEHGSNRDDEVNVLSIGNFGWNPGPGYDESVSMTDLVKYPDAIPAVWTSGNPTIAISGATIIEGDKWKTWDGQLLVAVQKSKHIRMLNFDSSGMQLVGDTKLFTQFGRIRTVVMGNDQELFIATDNGKGQDKIIKVTAQ